MKRPGCVREPLRRQKGGRGARRGPHDTSLHPAHDQLGNRGVLKALEALHDPGRAFGSEARTIAKRNGVETPPADLRVHWGPHSEAAARDLHAVAFTIGRDIFADTNRYPPGTAEGELVLAHEIHHTVEQQESDPELALLTETQFRAQLGARPEQAVAIDALFANATFRLLWDYLRTCPAAPARDHGPIRLVVTPGFTQNGVERFGGYSGMTRTLLINPTKREHTENPPELVDTIVHEVIHAVSDVEGDCVAAGGSPSPLPGVGTAPLVSGGLPPLTTTGIGPSASNPCSETIDITVAAQRIITDVIRENMRTTRLGAPTVTFLNELIRTNPSALAAYDTCRRPACALADAAARTAAISRCSMDVLGAFMTADVLPSRVLFDFDSSAIRPDAAMALDLVATFMRANPTTHVILEGHTDPTGSSGYNLRLGQLRAQAVRTFLLSRGVPASQIDDVQSAGKQRRLSTRAAEHFQDRRVELIFLSAP